MLHCPDLWFWAISWLHKCHSDDTTSPHHPSSAASNNTAWLSVVLLTPRCTLKVPQCICATTFLNLTVKDDYLSCFLLSIVWLAMMFQHAASHCKGFSLGPISLVSGVTVTDAPPLGALSSICLIQQQPIVIISHLLPP
jgi:hypothetical protein